ncbi:glycosyltransferase tibc (plasmid) [Gluconobacter frateurii NBRC 103465]|nr:glycosyltransferase tibc [Gluconobacter frateurii NBRC 103465]
MIRKPNMGQASYGTTCRMALKTRQEIVLWQNERAGLSMQHFFIGGSSGLAWLAWSAGCPVIMISGFTHPNNEFETPGRVINWHTCNSCWNDPKERFDHHVFFVVSAAQKLRKAV